jgi:hypothetical protein
MFQAAKLLRGQRNILTYQYGISSTIVDWALVWTTFDSWLESTLIPSLNKAIAEEENMEDSDEEEDSVG